MKIAFKITLIYLVVSGLATIFNIGVQAAFVCIYSGPYSVQLSVLLGTAAGIPIKYVLEKKHVFDFKADNLGHDTRLFILYGFMGVFTTAIFWGVEFAFQYIYGTDVMRYLGGAIGLTLGSFIKYHLDKRFVFKQELV
jgi:putative flippase GtrA